MIWQRMRPKIPTSVRINERQMNVGRKSVFGTLATIQR
jgi:hypothetical protein